MKDSLCSSFELSFARFTRSRERRAVGPFQSHLWRLFGEQSRKLTPPRLGLCSASVQTAQKVAPDGTGRGRTLDDGGRSKHHRSDQRERRGAQRAPRAEHPGASETASATLSEHDRCDSQSQTIDREESVGEFDELEGNAGHRLGVGEGPLVGTEPRDRFRVVHRKVRLLRSGNRLDHIGDGVGDVIGRDGQ